MNKVLYGWFALVFIYPDSSWEYVDQVTCGNFKTLEEANEERIYLQPEYDEPIHIIRETRQVVE